jgi:hypothetical protein
VHDGEEWINRTVNEDSETLPYWRIRDGTHRYLLGNTSKYVFHNIILRNANDS